MDDGRNENGIFNELLPRQRPNELLAEQWSGDKTMEMRRSRRVDWREGGGADQAAAVKWGERDATHSRPTKSLDSTLKGHGKQGKGYRND